MSRKKRAVRLPEAPQFGLTWTGRIAFEAAADYARDAADELRGQRWQFPDQPNNDARLFAAAVLQCYAEGKDPRKLYDKRKELEERCTQVQWAVQRAVYDGHAPNRAAAFEAASEALKMDVRDVRRYWKEYWTRVGYHFVWPFESRKPTRRSKTG